MAIKDSGLLLAYEELLASLRREGLPKTQNMNSVLGGNAVDAGDIFEYAAWFL